LDDKKFMAQAVNYANNDGVLWCILTNGVRWSVYKTNEPATMDRKLLLARIRTALESLAHDAP
jgi:predicted type IV restriction endonuclease